MNDCLEDPLGRPKPFIKWAGGKSRLASRIVSFFPKEYNKYYEPFLGGGAIYFEIAPQCGTLNDLNKNLIQTYTSVKNNPTELIDELSKVEEAYNALDSLEEKARYYYDIRDDYNQKEMSQIARSAAFIFLNKAGWNGMYRENSNGAFNIPFGKKERIKIYDKKNILSVSQNIQNMKFTSVDYKEAVRDAGDGDLIYFDPPYYPISKTASFTDYQKEGFGEKEQKELHDLALELVKRGCYVVVSNSNCAKSRDMYKDFCVKKISVSRTIGAKSSSRGRIEEIIALGQ